MIHPCQNFDLIACNLSIKTEQVVCQRRIEPMSEGGERRNCMFDWQSNNTAVPHSFEGPTNITEVRLTVRGK